MGFYAIAGWQPLDDDGAIVPGGTLTFTRTGTTTPKDVYSIKALTAGFELSNPYELDAAGRTAANIFMLDDEGYRVVLKDADGAPVWTRNEQFALSMTVDESVRRKSIARSPMDYGATGDGSADDTTAVQAAITAAAGGTVDLEGKTFKCTGTVTVSTSGTTVRNGKLLFTSAASTPITITGTRGTADNLSGNAALAATTCSVTSGASFSALDLVCIRSSSVLWGGNTLGQLEYLKSVSGTTLTFSGSRGGGTGGVLLGAYNTADSARVEKLTPITDIRFEDVTIESQATSATILTLTICERVSLRNCRFLLAATSAAVKMISCASAVVDGCHFAASSTSGYTAGVVIQEASRDVSITDSRFRFATTCIDVGGAGSVGGVCRYVSIAGCTAELTSKAVYARNGSKDVTVSDCSFNGGQSGASSVDLIDIEGFCVVVADCVLIDPIRHWIHIHPADNDIDDYAAYTVTGCQFSGTGSSGRMLTVSPSTAVSGVSRGAKINITGNEFAAGSVSSVDGILIGDTSAGGTFQAVNISGNTFATNVAFGSNNYHIHVKCNDAATVEITGNDIYAASSHGGVYIESGVDDVVIANNVLGSTAGATNGIALLDVVRAVVTGNTIFASGTGVDVSAATTALTDLVIANNQLACVDDGIEISAATGVAITRVSIAGNTISNATVTATEYCIELLTAGTGTISKVSIAGNVCDRADDSGPNVYLNGAGGAISRVSAVGNVLTNGTYGFSLVQVTGFSHSHNTFNGMATGQITGTLTRDGSKGFINLDITTIKLTAANVIINTTEGSLPDGDTAPILQRINGATDKAHRVTWAAASVVEVDFAPFAYPPDLDDSEAVTVNLLISKDTNTDTTAVVAVSYFEGIGDSNAGSNTAALATAAITKYAVTVTAGNIGAYPNVAKIGLTPGTHNNDAIRLHAAWIEYSKNPAMNAS